MKKLIAGAALVSTILGSGAYALADNSATTTTQTDATVQANSNLPQVTLTPDKLLYVLKMWAEKIQLVVTTDAAGKAALLETQAQTRLAEARAMAQAGKQDLAQAALLDAKVKLAAAQKEIEAAAKTNKDMSTLTSRIEADQISFASAITAMLDKAPESVRAEFQPVAAELMTQQAAAKAAPATPAAPAAPAAPAPTAATPASLEAAVAAQVNSAAQAPAPASKESAKAAVKAQAEAAKVETAATKATTKVNKAATKATTKVEKAAAKTEADDDREEADGDVQVEATSTTGIGFPLVNVKVHSEHGHKGGH